MRYEVRGLLFAAIILAVMPVQAAELRISDQPGFPVPLCGYVNTVPVLADISSAAGKEVIASSHGGCVSAFSSSGSLLWSFGNGLRGTTSSPAVGDINGDGSPEVVAAIAEVSGGGGAYYLYAWFGNGSYVPGYPFGINDKTRFITLADINNDGKDEIIFGGITSGNLYVYSGNGALLRQMATAGSITTKPAAGDIDNTGTPEIVVTSASNVYAWRSDGSPVAGWPKAVSVWDTSPEIGDIDGDGSNEIVVSSNDSHMYAWKGDGTSVPGFPVSTSKISYSSPAISDVNGDGKNEVVVGSDNAHVYVIKGDGTILPGWPQPTTGSVRSKPAFADIDKDGRLDIISGSNGVTVPSDGGTLYAWRYDGTVLLSRVIDTEWWIESSPAAADIDADGDIEIAIGSDNTNLYAVKVHALVPPVAGISSPSEGVIYAVGDAITFTSSSTDDGTIISYQWSSSISGTIGTTSSFTTSTLPAGVHIITLTVTDNDGLTTSKDVTITINSPPTISIISPASGSVHTMGTSVAFNGSASDSYGSIVSYEWTSDINGTLSTASSFSTSALADGIHNITFRAVDNNGASSTAQIWIRINIPPSVAILSPPDGSTYKQSDTVSFNGSASDRDGGVVSYLWTSDIDGVIGNTITFDSRSLSSGQHVISFTATDNDGAARSAQVKVTIGKVKSKDNSGGGPGVGGTGTGGLGSGGTGSGGLGSGGTGTEGLSSGGTGSGGLSSGETGTGGLSSGGTGSGGLSSGGTGTGGLGSGGTSTGGLGSGEAGEGNGSRSNDDNNVVFAETSKRRYVQKGSPTVFTFSNESNPVVNISILTKTTLGDISTTVHVLRHAPQSVESAPDGVVERYFSVYVGQSGDVAEDDFESAGIDFRVPRVWLDAYDIDRSTVRLGRYVNGDWSSLEPELLGEDEDNIYLRAETPGFSSFVVTGRTRHPVQENVTAAPSRETQAPLVQPDAQNMPAVPASGILAAVTAIAIAIILRTKKR